MDGSPGNVVIVVIDALRADRVGAFGCDRDLTPNLDDLAAGATVFENAFSCANTTDPSITSIHTGRFPRSTVYHHGRFVTLAEKRRVESVPRLPELCRDAGLATVAAGRGIGRWHVHGFDAYPDTDVRANETLHAVSSWLERVHPRLQSVAANAFVRLRTRYRRSSNEYSPSMTYADFHVARSGGASPLDSFFERLDARGGAPFYGFVHLMDTHTPYVPAPDLVDELLDAHDYPDAAIDVPDHQAGRAKLTREDYEAGVGRVHARYDGAVREADARVGALVERLKRRGHWDDTALFVLSDHGECLTEHGVFCDHHCLYDESVHVPLVCRIPGEAGGRVDDLVQLTDLTPTVLDLLDVDRSVETDGRSLVGRLRGGPEDDSLEPRDAVFAEEAHTQRRVAVRTRDWKYIEHVDDRRLTEAFGDSLRCRYCHTVHGGERELYDLEADPDEIRNVVSDHPETADRLRDRLHGYLDGLSSPDAAAGDVEYDDEAAVLQRLEDLGYR